MKDKRKDYVMDQHQRMVVAAALEKLIALEEGSFDHARVIIEACKSLKVTGASMSFKDTKSRNSTEGMTEHGNVSFEEEKETVVKEYGIHKERVGKWVIIKRIQTSGIIFRKNHTVLWISHFFHQDDGADNHRQYFLEYATDFSPVAFGYLGDHEIWFTIGHLSMYTRSPVVQLGETKLSHDGPTIEYFRPE